MTRSSLRMNRAAAWLDRIRIMAMFVSQFCTAYTSIIPVATLGCVLVSGTMCSNLQISGIAFAVIGSILALMEGKVDPGSIAVRFSVASRSMTRIARKIDLMLQRSTEARDDVDSFCEEIAASYEEIIVGLPSIPSFIFKTDDLLNLTLLSAYIDAPNTPECPPLDTYLKEKLEYEMARYKDLSRTVEDP